jgi:site-specific recombinase XerC
MHNVLPRAVGALPRPPGTERDGWRARSAAAENAASMTALVLLDAAGRRRSPATLPGFHCGRAPRNKGRRYPSDPPPVEEIIAVMRRAGDTMHGLRTRALIVLLWRAGLRISEVHRHRPDCWTTVVRRRRPQHPPPSGCRRWRTSPLRAPPAAAAHAVEMAREGVPLNVIQRQLGHANLGITSVYLQGIDNAEIIATVYARRAPMLPASAGLAWHA